MANKQIPALPPLDKAPADDDRLAIRDTSSGSDKSLRVDRMLERSADQVSEHSNEEGGIHGIPEGERAINSEELLSSVSEAADIDEAVSFVGKGAIVESGTNANGSYIRWENGEQVTWQMSPVRTTDEDTVEIFDDNDYPADFVEVFAKTPGGINRLDGDHSFTTGHWPFDLEPTKSDDTGRIRLREASETADVQATLATWGRWK